LRKVEHRKQMKALHAQEFEPGSGAIRGAARKSGTHATCSSIAGVPEADLTEMKPARGIHNPTAELCFVGVPEDASQLMMLRETIGQLSAAGRSELYALMRVGEGRIAAQKWNRGLAEAVRLGDDTITAALIEDPDLHDHLMKTFTRQSRPPDGLRYGLAAPVSRHLVHLQNAIVTRNC
jgi:Protein of unknown function (DUF3775)